MPKSLNSISVIGLGYIGLPTAAMFAARRKTVIGVDINRQTVATVNEGRIHIVEPQLDMLVRATVREGFLRAALVPEPADAFLIAVPTPFRDDHVPDLTYVRAAVDSIAPVLKKDDLIVLESTSPVGTTEQVAAWLSAARPDLSFPGDVAIAYCPERVLPGHVVRELVANDRVVGGLTEQCSRRACDLYRIFVEGKLLITNARTAEMTKLTENAFRDVNIAFANELSVIASKMDINVWELISLANHHPRVNILRPGPGVGGHCIAVDPWFIVHSAPQESRMIRTARETNDAMPAWVLEKVRAAVAQQRKERPVIAVFGLAFKPDIDDLRESPAAAIAEHLLREYPGRVLAVEPHIESLPAALEGGALCTAAAALEQADIVLVLVAHQAFKTLHAQLLPHQALIDTVGL